MIYTNFNFFILIPIYNAEQYLKECLESIANQTYKNFICVMINDGSTDSSPKICKEFTNDKRFILLSQENKGVAAARNYGLNYILQNSSENDFLTFIDADDFVENSYLEKVSNFLHSSNLDSHDTMYLCGWKQLQKTKSISHLIEQKSNIIQGDFRNDYENLDSFLQTLWSNFYDIALIKKEHLHFDEQLNISEDIAFNFKYAYFIRKYVFINECLYNYRELPNSLSRTNIQTEARLNMRFRNLERRLHFLTECDIKSKQFVLNKHISNMVSGSIFLPNYKRLYELKKLADPKFTRSKGQKRVIFCLKHNLLWIYRFYIKYKNILLKK